jgi:hypothetical protein
MDAKSRMSASREERKHWEIMSENLVQDIVQSAVLTMKSNAQANLTLAISVKLKKFVE